MRMVSRSEIIENQNRIKQDENRKLLFYGFLIIILITISIKNRKYKL